MARLSREQQQRLASSVIDTLGNLAEQIADGEMWWQDESAAPAADLIAQLAVWARRIPGDAWDTRLGDPDPNRPLS